MIVTRMPTRGAGADVGAQQLDGRVVDARQSGQRDRRLGRTRRRRVPGQLALPFGAFDPHHVVLLGSGRSGTSITGELFEGLPTHHYLFEPLIDEISALPFDAPIAMKVPRDADPRAFTPGLPFNLDRLLALVPEPRRLVWIVRNPLDAVCSLRPGIEAGWAHNPRPPDWEDLLDQPLIERCAHHWAWINGPGYEAVARHAVVVRYEDLVADPRTTGEQLVRLAGVAPLAVHRWLGEWSARVGNRHDAATYHARRQSVWSRDDHVRRVGRWKENLSRDDVERLAPIVADVAARFGYDLPYSRRTLGSRR